MIGKLKDLIIDKNGNRYITVVVRDNFEVEFDTLKDCDVDIAIKKHSAHRSLDANAYCWLLCGRIAEKMSDDGVIYTKADIYKQAIKEVGVYKDFEFDPDDAKTLRSAWEMLGTGWITEQVDYSQNGEKVVVRCYYGSSRYNAKQMSRLIDNLIQDCDALGIEHRTPEEIENLKSLWATAPTERN